MWPFKKKEGRRRVRICQDCVWCYQRPATAESPAKLFCKHPNNFRLGSVSMRYDCEDNRTYEPYTDNSRKCMGQWHQPKTLVIEGVTYVYKDPTRVRNPDVGQGEET